MERCEIFVKEKEEINFFKPPELHVGGFDVLNEMSKLKRKFDFLKREYFQNLYNPLIQFVKKGGKIIEDIKDILFIDNENYLQILFLVNEPNISKTYRISELIYDIRTKFPDIELDFMVLDEKEEGDEIFNKNYIYHI